MSALVAFVSGLVFAVGLAVAGMTQPQKVVGFLDVAGAWDPSLALVMGAGVLVFGAAHAVTRRRAAPLFGGAFPPPPSPVIDARLLAGAVIFGVGWGLSGFCPGPAIVAVAAGAKPALVFVPAMAAGMIAFSVLTPKVYAGCSEV